MVLTFNASSGRDSFYGFNLLFQCLSWVAHHIGLGRLCLPKQPGVAGEVCAHPCSSPKLCLPFPLGPSPDRLLLSGKHAWGAGVVMEAARPVLGGAGDTGSGEAVCRPALRGAACHPPSALGLRRQVATRSRGSYGRRG